MFDRLRAAIGFAPPNRLLRDPDATDRPTPPPPDGVYQCFDATNGRTFGQKPFGEEHYKNGVHHRDGDLPAIHHTRNGDDRKEWLIEGLHDRATGPAIEILGLDGYEARHFRKGRQHNADGPAVAIDGPDGVVREWWKDGVLQSRFEEFHGVEPDYQAPGGAKGGPVYRQQVFDTKGEAIFTASSSTDPFSWGERQERFERRPTTEERLSVEARLLEQRAYFDKIGGMSPWDAGARTVGRYHGEEDYQPRPGGVKAAAAAAQAKPAEAQATPPKRRTIDPDEIF